ncbi:MAG: flagellar biosynthesis protein FlhA [Planctomycetes bacterium]|nr:flagellar biosynthesis protein FlhA [Planctomycetota bacterium]MCC7396768.1 flagellar biosynthesis protein FlhA [Planctomycetota bacterium]
MTTTTSQTKRNGFLAIFFLGILTVMLIPLPPLLLDAMLCINITVSLLILMAVINASRPVEFSTFPSVLLFSALFRLALNVSSTRLILLEGDAGDVIRTFGNFVVGGDPLVGIVIFLVLVVIQFIVITKGQNRISEVAARFALDAMPGKQMSIDADLGAGLISADEAKAKRAALTTEMEFYGSMDGAGKFVRGDAVAGLIITGINITGGLVMAMVVGTLTLPQAFEKYTILTIGDGLVAQIPALLVSTASGILVTKGASERALGQEMGDQMLASGRTLRLVSGVLVLMALLPGMPTMLFASIAAAMFLFAGRVDRTQQQAADAAKTAETATEAPDPQTQPVEEMLAVDRLGIEIGYRLIGLVEPGRHGGLLDHIRSLRRQFAQNLGLVVPPIRVRDNVQLEPNAYRVLLGGQEIARGTLRAGHYLAMDPSGSAPAIAGIETIEPAFGLPARWIAESDKDRAELLGYTVIDAASVLITHLTEVLKKTAGELLTRDDVKSLVDNLKKQSPAVVEELIPGMLTLGQVQRILAGLLKEGVPIRNLQTILEALADASIETKDPRQLTEHVRSRLSRTIVEPHLDPAGTLYAAFLDPELEKNLAEALAGNDGVTNLPTGFLGRFVDRTAEALAKMAKTGRDPVLVTRSSLRPFLADAIAGVIPNAAVLSYQETTPAKKVETTQRIAVAS